MEDDRERTASRPDVVARGGGAGAAILFGAIAYGHGLRRLARRGLLPMPEE